jgi:CheY-like chemotaxis protein
VYYGIYRNNEIRYIDQIPKKIVGKFERKILILNSFTCKYLNQP